MTPHRLSLLAAAAVLCLAAGCLAEDYKALYKSFKEIPGIQKAEDGQRYIVAGEGEETKVYLVAKDEASKNIYFIDAESKQPQWSDPRGEGELPSSVCQRLDL